VRERVAIQTISLADDGYGGKTETLSTLATVWAKVSPVKGREVEKSGRMESVETYLVMIRYRADVTTAHRILWSGKLLNIRSVQNRDEKRQFLTLECEKE